MSVLAISWVLPFFRVKWSRHVSQSGQYWIFLDYTRFINRHRLEIDAPEAAASALGAHLRERRGQPPPAGRAGSGVCIVSIYHLNNVFSRHIKYSHRYKLNTVALFAQGLAAVLTKIKVALVAERSTPRTLYGVPKVASICDPRALAIAQWLLCGLLAFCVTARWCTFLV